MSDEKVKEPEIRFRHIRATVGDDEGEWRTQNGGLTLAFVMTSPRHSKTRRFDVAVAHCSDKDHFCKKTGRQLAEINLRAGRTISVIVPPCVPTIMMLDAMFGWQVRRPVFEMLKRDIEGRLNPVGDE
jgi:hypothetical protein